MEAPVDSIYFTWTPGRPTDSFAFQGVIEVSTLLDLLNHIRLPEYIRIKSAKTGDIRRFVYGRELVANGEVYGWRYVAPSSTIIIDVLND